MHQAHSIPNRTQAHVAQQAQTVPVLSQQSQDCAGCMAVGGICFVAAESEAHLLRSHLDFAKALQEEQKRKVHVEMKTVRSKWADDGT